MTSQTLRVLLLEPNKADSDLIAAHLESRDAGQVIVVERASDVEVFKAKLSNFFPDVILSGHNTAGLNVKALLDLIHSAHATTPLIVLTDSFDEETTVASLRSGAANVVLKQNLSRLMPSIVAALEGRRDLDRLSPRQREVLRLVAEGHTTREIAQALNLSAKTVETHRGAVMKRLEIHDLVGLVRYALRVGLVAPDK